MFLFFFFHQKTLFVHVNLFSHPKTFFFLKCLTKCPFTLKIGVIHQHLFYVVGPATGGGVCGGVCVGVWGVCVGGVKL